MPDLRDSDDSATPLVSVVIAARDEAPWIAGCIASLAAQGYPPDRLEVILVDGCSVDGTGERAARQARSHGLALRVLENSARIAPAGFNVGISASRGAVVVILGARARPAPDFVQASVTALWRSGAEAVGGVVETVASSERLVARAVALAQRSPFGVGDAGYRYAAREQEVDTVNYGAYRREVFDRVGRFDESLQWVEDDEFNYRLRKAGGRLVLDPVIRVRYLARPTLGTLWHQRFHWGLNKPRVAARHPGQMRLRHLVPAGFVLALAGGALLWPLGPRWRWPLGALMGAYGGTTLVATARLSARNRWPPETALLPAAFVTMHVAYGIGTLLGAAGLVARRLGGRRTVPRERRS